MNRTMSFVFLMCLIPLAGCYGYLDDFDRTWSYDSGVPEGAPIGDGGPTGDSSLAPPALPPDGDASTDASTLPPGDEPPERPVDPDDGGTPPPWDGGGVVEDELVTAGGACDCDSDCEGTDGFAPLCIHGICGVNGSDNSCPAGSAASCPSGHRCWSGTGRGVCYPDFVAGECSGTEDSDGSCVSVEGRDCYAACGVLCDLPGDPPGTVDPGDDDPPVEPGDCEYPSGPHAVGPGSVIPPMQWPSAIAGSAESGEADLADLRCDGDVNSIFIDVGATWCAACGERMAEIAGLRDHWIATGVTWIFIVSDASSAAAADTYVNRYGIDFGFRTNDADNSEGSGTIASSSLFSTIPWVGVIRADDMVMLYEEGSSGYLDFAGIATELSD